MTSAHSMPDMHGSWVAQPWEAVVSGPTRIPVPERTHEHTPREKHTHRHTQSHSPSPPTWAG